MYVRMYHTYRVIDVQKIRYVFSHSFHGLSHRFSTFFRPFPPACCLSLSVWPKSALPPTRSVQRLNVRPYILGIPANDRVSPAVRDNAKHEEICPKTCRDPLIHRSSGGVLLVLVLVLVKGGRSSRWIIEFQSFNVSSTLKQTFEYYNDYVTLSISYILT